MRKPFLQLPVLLLLQSSVANSAEYCINSQQGLEAFMEQFQNGQIPSGDQTIRIAAGNYEIGVLSLAAADGSLLVEGGFDTACATKTPGAAATTIQSDGAEPLSFHAFGALNANLSVRDLTLAGFPVAFVWPQSTNASIELDRVAFLFTPAFANADGLQMFPTDGEIRLRNVVADASTGGCAVHASNTRDMQIEFVTIRNRGTGPAACLASFGGAPSMTNSILRSEEGADLQFTGDAQHRLVLSSSMAAKFAGDPISAASSGNLAVEPTFQATGPLLLQSRIADLDVQPARDSALAIAGTALDILGQPRIVGAAPDRGAFELQLDTSQSVFGDGFETF